MPSADPMRAIEQAGSQDTPHVAAAAGGVSASLRCKACANLDLRECEKTAGLFPERYIWCGACGARQINVAELDDANRADVREWALGEMYANQAGASSIREFLLGNISATALVAGKWADWRDAA